MKIRVYYPFFPFPIVEAAYLSVFNQLHGFVDQGHDVELVFWKDTLESAQQKMKESHVEPWSSKIHLMSLNKEAGELESTMGRWKRVAQSLSSPYASSEEFHYPAQLFFDYLENQEMQPVDLAIYHYSFCYPWICNGLRSDEKKQVVYYHNLEFELFEQRAERATWFLDRWIHKLNAKKLKKHELVLGECFDEIWQHSKYDAEKLNQLTGRQWKQKICPPSMRVALYEARVAHWRATVPNSKLLQLGFIGGLGHGPNLSSALWLTNEVSPLLEQNQFTGEMIFAGKSLEAFQVKTKKYSFIKHMGFLQDPEPFWSQLSFLLVPHIEGSGIRVKILEALASGIPVIINDDAARALPGAIKNLRGVIICNEPEEWAKVILSQKPFQLRKEITELGFPKELVTDYLQAENYLALNI